MAHDVRRTDLKPSDEDLVGFCLDGDSRAFEVLVARYQRRLTGFLTHFVGDLELARELTQESLLRAWKALDRFDPSYKFSTWLFRIAHNLGVDHLRRKTVPTRPIEMENPDGDRVELSVTDGGKDPLGHLENRELAAELRNGIGRLRPEYRELVLLRHFAGLSYQEISDLKGIPLGTVKNKLFRAHTVLRNALSRYLAAGTEGGSA